MLSSTLNTALELAIMKMPGPHLVWLLLQCREYGIRNEHGWMEDLLRKNKCPKDKKHTHTRIPNKNLNVFGGSYYIEDSLMPEFWHHYYNKVWKKNPKDLKKIQIIRTISCNDEKPKTCS